MSLPPFLGGGRSRSDQESSSDDEWGGGGAGPMLAKPKRERTANSKMQSRMKGCTSNSEDSSDDEEYVQPVPKKRKVEHLSPFYPPL
jgi:hypothetical protein